MRSGLLAACVLVSAAACSARDRGQSTESRQAQPTERAAVPAWPEAVWSQGGLRTHGLGLAAHADGFVPLGNGASVRLPSTSDGPLHVEANAGYWVEQRALEAGSERAIVEADRVRFDSTAVSHAAVMLATERGAEELRVLATAGERHVARYRITTSGGIATLSLRQGVVEALDAQGNARLRSPQPIAVDARGTRRQANVSLERDGSAWVLTVTLFTADLSFPVVVDPGWFLTTSMASSRQNFTATTLPSGKVLVAGGDQDGARGTMLSSTEIYDPATHTWTLGPAMTAARTLHAAALLPSGSVLVTGGGDSAYMGHSPTPLVQLCSAEIYDGTKWTATGSMSTCRALHVALTTSKGTVVAAGGFTGSTAGTSGTYTTKTAEVFDPATGKWTPTGNYMTDYRTAFGGVALPGGRLLFVGGYTYYNSLKSTDYYDPTTNTFSPGPTLITARVWPSIGVLDDGSVLVAGGASDMNKSSSPFGLTAAELLGPSAGAWSAVGALATPHVQGMSAVVPDATGKPSSQMMVASGYALSAGSGSAEAYYSNVELFDRTTKVWVPYGVLTVPRFGGAAVASSTTNIAIIGGGTSTPSLDNTSGTPTVTTTSVEITGTAIADHLACTDNGTCASGFCVDGYCCDRGCTGQCEACDVSGREGVCTAIAGAVHGTRKACGGSPECASTCNGSGPSCAQGTATTPCGAGSCVGNSISGLGTCSGDSSNKCNPAASASCPGDLMCASDGKHCRTKCVDGRDCIAGDVCNPTSGLCSAPPPDAGPPDSGPDTSTDAAVTDAVAADTLAILDAPSPPLPPTPTVGPFQRCVHDADCASTHCVDGVCCDSACTDRCHSCALLSNPGKCTLEPAGVDLRSECGAADTCTGTCGGDGQCIGAGAGTMCARNVCTGPSTGNGPAYCSGPGAVCTNASVVAFDCGAYACAPAFGACLTACTTSADCSKDNTCDLPTKTCVPTAAPAKQGGCEIGRGEMRGAWWAAFVMGCVSLRRRRVKARREHDVTV